MLVFLTTGVGDLGVLVFLITVVGLGVGALTTGLVLPSYNFV